MKNENIMHTILKGKCPRCHKGKMYKNSNPYILSKLFKMHERCSSCSIKFKIEPSFFFGAMYISYGLSVLLAVITFLLSFLVFDLILINCFKVIVCLLMISSPIIGRLSKNIWIVFFVKYDPKFEAKQLG